MEELQPERNLSHQQLFQVMFALAIQDFVAGLESAGWNGHSVRKFDMTLAMAGEGYLGGALSITSTFRVPIQAMVKHLSSCGSIVANPDQRLSALPLLTVQSTNARQLERHET